MEQKIISIPMPGSFRQAAMQANRNPNPQPSQKVSARPYRGGKHLAAKEPRNVKRNRKQAASRALFRSAKIAIFLLVLVLGVMIAVFLLATALKGNVGAVMMVEPVEASEVPKTTHISSSRIVDDQPAPAIQADESILFVEESVEEQEEELPIEAEAQEETAMPEEEVQPVILPVPDVPGTAFKTFMDYRAITDKTSGQYKLQQAAETNELGFRTYNGLPMIAIGTYYVERVGYTVRVYLDNGNTFSAVVGDIKSDAHTTETHQVMPNGNVVEFIVDGKSIPSICWKMGDMSYADDAYSGAVVGIEILEVPNN